MNLPRSSQFSTAPFPANILTLEGGLTLIHQHVPSGVVAVDVWVKAGAIVEPDEWSGMAHFLEHMIFKGTDRQPPGSFDHAIENRGGMTNAATSYDYAHYFITTAAHHLGDTLPHLGDLLVNAAIPDDEFDRERDVVLEEIRQTYDNPDCIAFEALMESVYQRHPYGRSILGTEEKLMERSPAEMRQFHRSHYQPDNMTVVIVGDVSQDEAIREVDRAFHPFQMPLTCAQSSLEAEPPLTGIRRQELRLPRLEQARLMMAWMTPGIKTPPLRPDVETLPWQRFPEAEHRDPLQDAYGLEVLSVLLAESRSSRLVQELREERQLVQGISSGFTLQRESGIFTITAWLDPDQLERVEALICDRLSELITTPVAAGELARAKRLLCNDYAFSTETPSQLAGLYGYYHTIAQAEVAVSYPQRIQAITLEDLQELASCYLSPYRYATIVMKAL
ncbi:M16 family metallopeptidase [Phormidesmis sp. 146-12]